MPTERSALPYHAQAGPRLQGPAADQERHSLTRARIYWTTCLCRDKWIQYRRTLKLQ